MVGGQLHGALTRHSVKRVEADCTWHSPEAGEVLQGHLGGAVVTLGGREREGSAYNWTIGLRNCLLLR